MDFKASALTLLVAVTAAACGGSKASTPTSPTPATPTVNSVTVSGLDAIRTGFFSNFTAQATLSDGTTQSVTPTWSSDNPSVATVAANGDVTGQSNGTATITATHQGRSGSKTVRVVANFGGTWSGTYRISKCDQSGALAGWCQGIGGVGAVLPVSLNLTQGGSGRDQIGGTLSLGSITGNISGNVTGDGRMILSGSFTFSTSGLTALFTFGGWDTRLSGATGMVGRWAHTIAFVGRSGNAYQENDLVSMTHLTFGSSAPAGAAVESEGLPIVEPAPSVFPMTLEEAARRMRP